MRVPIDRGSVKAGADCGRSSGAIECRVSTLCRPFLFACPSTIFDQERAFPVGPLRKEWAKERSFTKRIHFLLYLVTRM
jgi:hypothetical protein